MCSWNVTAPCSLLLEQTHAHGDNRNVTWIPLTGLYWLFFPVRGHEPSFGLSQPMTEALPWPLLLPSCPGAPAPCAPDDRPHPGGWLKLPVRSWEIKVPPALMSQMFTDQLLLARHRGNGREPREERQTGKEQTGEG